MLNEVLIGIIGAVIGAIISGLFAFALDKRKAKRLEAKERELEYKNMIANRPELRIIDFKDYRKRIGYGKNNQVDIQIFLSHIKNVLVKDSRVEFLYNNDDKKIEEWCYVLYTFENVGKTDIAIIDVICNDKKDTALFEAENVEFYLDNKVINYSICFDKKIRIGEKFSLKICYHKDRIIEGGTTALICIGFKDSNGNHWKQPLIVPEEKIYESYYIEGKEYIDGCKVDNALACFRNPYLW